MEPPSAQLRPLAAINKTALEAGLRAALPRCRWFGGRARSIAAVMLVDAIPLESEGWLVLARIEYLDGAAETFALPLKMAHGKSARELSAEPPGKLLVPLPPAADGEPVVLYDALADVQLAGGLLRMIANGGSVAGTAGELVAWSARAFAALRGDSAIPLKIATIKAEQSNSSIVFGDRLIMKLFRRLEDGPNPELEISAFLAERANFSQVPPLAGAIEYRRQNQPAGAIAVLQGFVPNQGDAWKFTLDQLADYFDGVLALPPAEVPLAEPVPRVPPAMLIDLAIPDLARQRIGPFLSNAELLGRRTAEMHKALATGAPMPDFAPEPFVPADHRGLLAECEALTRQTLTLLRERLSDLPAGIHVAAQRLLELEPVLVARFAALADMKFTARRIRCHGDYHLGQVLFTGEDFMILDFEGEPARSLAERRVKRSPLKDVAGMLRSFDYAVHFALHTLAESRPAGDMGRLQAWGDFWHLWTCTAFLQAYHRSAAGAVFLPDTRDELSSLLDIYLLEKAVYELKYELNNRPDWVAIPLAAIVQLADP